jgi:hypothetical protein
MFTTFWGYHYLSIYKVIGKGRFTMTFGLDQVPVIVAIMMLCCALFYTRVIIFKKSLELELNKVFEQVYEVSTCSYH